MLYQRYATQVKDGNNNIYGIMDEDARQLISEFNLDLNNIEDDIGDIEYAIAGKLDRPQGTGAIGQVPRLGNNGMEWAAVGLPTDEQTEQAVSNWLDDHPEATTTVQDGSLTIEKFTDTLKLLTKNKYITPEQFGAVGNGVNDDTVALQSAIDYAIANSVQYILLSGKYAVRSLYIINNTYPLNIVGTGGSLTRCSLVYTGATSCINISNGDNITLSNFAIYSNLSKQDADEQKGEEYTAIRFYDADASLVSDYHDARCDNVYMEYLQINRFRVGITIDVPCGHITIRECYASDILHNGYALRIGKYFNSAYYPNRYKVNPNYVWVLNCKFGGTEISNNDDYQLSALIGLYRLNHIVISECDFANLRTAPAIRIYDENNFVSSVYITNNTFYNVKNAITVNKSRSCLIRDIVSVGNRYVAGAKTGAVFFNISGIDGEPVYGISSVGDIFTENEAGIISKIYNFDYVRNIEISGVNLSPTGLQNIWDSNLYTITKNCTNIIGEKAKRVTVSGTTDTFGNVNVVIQPIFNDVPYVLTNVLDSTSTFYMIAVNAYTRSTGIVSLRIRSTSGVAIADTSVNFNALLFGV